MGGALLGLAVVAALAATALLVALPLGIRRPSELVLAAWLLSVAEVVGLSLFLSLFEAMTRTALVAGVLFLLAGSVGVWLLADAPRPLPLPYDVLRMLGFWPLLLLGGVVLLALGYASALILGTPPNGWDQLNYHLTRAAFWAQESQVGYLDYAYDERINFFPPNGEIPVAFLLGVTKLEVSAAFVQLSSALAAAVGVFALSRRVGFDHRHAAFGALLFLTLPIVVLQATTTKNDLVVAALLITATVFLLGESRRVLALAGLAVALAVGTKFTATYGVAILAVLAVVAPPPGQRISRIAAIAVGGLVGSYWYVVNLVETDLLLGDRSNIPGLTAPLQPRENLFAAFGLGVDVLDVSGAVGSDVLLYLLAALAVGIGLVLAGTSWGRAALAAVAVASPLAILVVAEEVARPALLELHSLLGEPQAFLAEGDDLTVSPATASDTGSWFGPLGLLLVSGVGATALVLVRRRALPAVAAVLAVAPLAWLALVALSLTYHPWQGRFFIYPVALSAALWGLVPRSRAAAWSAVALGATTVFLSLVHYAEKPSGLRLFESTGHTSVWSLERWEAQSLHDPAVQSLFRFVDEDVPPDAPVALAFGANDFGYPVFGPRLARRITLVPFESAATEVESAWLVANPERAAEISEECWLQVLAVEGGAVFRRGTPDCALG